MTSKSAPCVFTLILSCLKFCQVHSLLIMVEGHSVHRLASAFRTKLVGRKFTASSPNGRFVDGASAIDGRVLSRMEAVGKNLFAFFRSEEAIHTGVASDDGDEDVVVVHVHFGMSGAWATYDTLVEEEPDVKPTTRLRLEEITASTKATEKRAVRKSVIANNTAFVTHLSAMTVAHGNTSLYTEKKSSLGEDPLRTDADPDILYQKVFKSKKSIGQLIMDQSYFTGPGNIYRAEILFLAGVHPVTPGKMLDRPTFDRIWSATVKLLRRGYDTGSILTVDANADPKVAARGERRYIYNKSNCARCGGRVSSWDMAGRTCYACEGGCQPKMKAESPIGGVNGHEVVEVSKQSTNSKKCKQERQQHVPFISHCALISYQQRLEQCGPEHLTIAELRSVMEQLVRARHGDSPKSDYENTAIYALPPKSARKSVHVEALKSMLEQQRLQQHSKKIVKEEDKVSSRSSKPLPPPLVSAEDAAREKALSGENRAVEHIAELSREQAVRATKSAVTPSPAVGARVGKIVTKSDGKKNQKKKKIRAADETGLRRSSRRRLNYDS
ncbi:hypothetical protein ACHAWF_014125 [Thalassiosira exigua]